jgi:diaminohydroxyphosphoribosylaminopyrimidine deaminase/5-amino-6-(5-phosphoribosylamino)uracil reductase
MHPPRDHVHMLHAARLALRGHGGAEPNPLVGCVIVDAADRVVGWGYHRRCGEAHAEVAALRSAGAAARGATAYVTLEPCNHTGRTGPCTEALIAAGIRRVVVARRDPNPAASGGLDRLREAGVLTQVLETCEPAVRVCDPFMHRLRTGLPWVTVKWAQTIDGRIATRDGDSRWISGERSRRLVHRERGRVDCILTGIGTVLRDDPLLTARGVRRRRIARRVVVDPALRMPPDARLVASAAEAPLTIACGATVLADRADDVQTLRRRGVDVLDLPTEGGELSLEALLRELVARHDATHVLVEAGPGLTRRLVQRGLANELWVFIAPIILGDPYAIGPVERPAVERIADGLRLRLRHRHQRGEDLVLRYSPAAGRP